MLNDGQELLTIHGSTVKSMAYMESIARIRFVLCITADICHDYLIDTTKYEDLPRQEKTAIKQLIVRVSELCANVVMVPEDCLKHFIIKQVVKGYGYTCWLAISQHELLKTWITPSTLKFAVRLQNSLIIIIKQNKYLTITNFDVFYRVNQQLPFV